MATKNCKVWGCWHKSEKDGYCSFHYKKLDKKTIGDIYG